MKTPVLRAENVATHLQFPPLSRRWYFPRSRTRPWNKMIAGLASRQPYASRATHQLMSDELLNTSWYAACNAASFFLRSTDIMNDFLSLLRPVYSSLSLVFGRGCLRLLLPDLCTCKNGVSIYACVNRQNGGGVFSESSGVL